MPGAGPLLAAVLYGLVRLIRDHRIDVIHWNFTSPLTNRYVWLLSVLCPRVRHWYTDHIRAYSLCRRPPRDETNAEARLLTRYSRVLSVSEFVKKCMDSNESGQARFA